jgi:transcriptional regulator with XRE-family HTH domain
MAGRFTDDAGDAFLVADALGLTFQKVQKYEKGANRIGASRLQHISQILDVPDSVFLRRRA